MSTNIINNNHQHEHEEEDEDECPGCLNTDKARGIVHCCICQTEMCNDCFSPHGDEVYCKRCVPEDDEEEEEMCGVCHKTCKTDDTDDLVLITEINGVKHCDECLHAFLAKRAAK